MSVVDGSGIARAARSGDRELGALHVHHVPLGRHAEGEMRIANDERLAAGGMSAVDDPAVGTVEPAATGTGLGFEVGQCVGECVRAVGP